MFTIDNNVMVDKKRDWTPDESVNGMKYASIPRSYSVTSTAKGSALVAMYLESLRYRLQGSEQMAALMATLTTQFNDTSRKLSVMMDKAITKGFIKNSKVHYCNDILTLKWFMHEYKQCIVELKHTTTTEVPSSSEITSTGVEIDDGNSIGYLMYGYDNDGVLLQGVNGIEGGAAGFYTMSWDVFQVLFIKGAVFGLPQSDENEYVKCLTFTAVEPNSTIKMIKNNSYAPTPSLQYSVDKGLTWNDFLVNTTISGTDGTLVTLANAGDEIMIKAKNPNQSLASNTSSYYNRFIFTGTISASGNVNSLLDGDNFQSIRSLNGRDYTFLRLFTSCTQLVRPPVLPALELSKNGYSYMFYGCTNLRELPKLPATTLADRCYQAMFYNCSSVTTPIKLPAMTIPTYAYSQMFYGCSSLTKAPKLPAMNLNTYSYSGMFTRCTSLTTAPDLPATVIPASCYNQLFNGCTSLTSIKIGYTGTLNSTGWVTNVAPTGTFYYNGSDTTRGTAAIPEGWSIVRY